MILQLLSNLRNFIFLLLNGFLWGAFCFDVQAQRINIGGGVGGFNYKGDMSPTFNPRNYLPGGHLLFRYNASPAVSFKLAGTLGIAGAKDSRSSDPFIQNRNQSFRTNVLEWSAITEYNFLNYSQKRKANNWTPYLFGGVSYYNFSPQPQTSDYKTAQLNIPYGVGVKWEFRRPWSIEVEFGTRKLFTDYFDDLGDNIPLSQRTRLGNPALRDQYYYTSITLSYTFYTIFCPPSFSVE